MLFINFLNSDATDEQLIPQTHTGWQSQRFCVYPQDLVIQFPGMVKINQLSFLLHQFKIPRIIELFYYAPLKIDQNTESQILQSGAPFKKLGHFTLDDNMKTNYQARELKTVYVECTCQFLKISFQKNHDNDQNIFQQVGLVFLKVQGQALGNYEASILSGAPIKNSSQIQNELVPRNMKIESVN